MGGTVLVAGAADSTGRALVRILSKAGVAVRVGGRLCGTVGDLGPVERIDIDYTNLPTLARAFRGVDRVFMVAPMGPEMAAMTETMVTVALKAGVRRFLRLSCQAATAPESFALGRWHRAAERVIENSGMAWTHLRPNGFMQNFTNYHLRSMKTLGLFHDPVGSVGVSHVDAEDVAAVAAAVLTQPGHDGRVYGLTGPAPLSSHEVAALYSRMAGRTIRCVEVSIESARDAMFGFGLPTNEVNAIAELYQGMRDGYFAEVTPTIEAILQRPPRTFAAFVESQRELFCESPERR